MTQTQDSDDGKTVAAGQFDRRRLLHLLGSTAAVGGVTSLAGCIGGGTDSSEGDTSSPDGGSANDAPPGGDAGAATAAFDCSKFLESRPFTGDKPTFTFTFDVPKSWDVFNVTEFDDQWSVQLGEPETAAPGFLVHGMVVHETMGPRDRQSYVEFRTKYLKFEKLEPLPYGSDEMVVLYKFLDESSQYGIKGKYLWELGLPTGTDGEIRITKVSAFYSNRSGKKPACKEAVQKATENTVASIKPAKDPR